jgi:hypothetical protein
MMLFGNGDRMDEVRDLIERVADTDVTVLVRARAAPARSWWHGPFTSARCARTSRSSR